MYSSPRLRRGENSNSAVTLLVHNLDTSRAEIVRWVAESFRPFSIVSDRGLVFLMKTGRPHYYLPSPWTVSRDVRLIFARTRQRIAAMLQVSFSLFRRAVVDLPDC